MNAISGEGQLLDASFVCEDLEIIGSVFVNVDIPIAVELQAWTDCPLNKIAFNRDAAHNYTQFTVPNQCQITVKGIFSGKSIIFMNDSVSISTLIF